MNWYVQLTKVVVMAVCPYISTICFGYLFYQGVVHTPLWILVVMMLSVLLTLLYKGTDHHDRRLAKHNPWKWREK